MDIVDKIGRVIKEDLQDEYDALKKQLQAAKERKASQSSLDLIRDKMSRLRVRIVTGHD
jgi:hypothetical protein